MTNNLNSFNNLDRNSQRKVRVGAYEVSESSYYAEDFFQKLSLEEVNEYILIGEKVEKQRKWRQLVWSVAGSIGLVILIGYFVYEGKLDSNKLQAHYSGIKTADVCGILKNTSFNTASTDETVTLAPEDVKTEYEDNDRKAKCGLYVRVEQGSDSLVAFLTVNLSKTASNKPPKENVDVEVLKSERYTLYQYENTQNFYSFTVLGGIDPDDSTFDEEYNAIVAKLLVMLAGIEFENKLPANDSVVNLR